MFSFKIAEIELLKKFFFLSGKAFTPSPLLVAMPLKKYFFAASLTCAPYNNPRETDILITPRKFVTKKDIHNLSAQSELRNCLTRETMIILEFQTKVSSQV